MKYVGNGCGRVTPIPGGREGGAWLALREDFFGNISHTSHSNLLRDSTHTSTHLQPLDLSGLPHRQPGPPLRQHQPPAVEVDGLERGRRRKQAARQHQRGQLQRQRGHVQGRDDLTALKQVRVVADLRGVVLRRVWSV